MIDNQQWSEIAKLYKELPKDAQESFDRDFGKILQDEIDKEVIRQITNAEVKVND